MNTGILGALVANNKLYTDQFPWRVVATTVNSDGRLLLHCILTEGNTRGDTAVFGFSDVQFDPAGAIFKVTVRP
jgi:hypothetical protein